MILVDTSIWIDHIRTPNSRLIGLLDAQQVGVHPWVVGELACGNLAQRAITLYLLRSLPRLGEKKTRLDTISGNVPNPLDFPTGCKFHPRCPLSLEKARGRPEAETRPIAGTRGARRNWFAGGGT